MQAENACKMQATAGGGIFFMFGTKWQTEPSPTAAQPRTWMIRKAHSQQWSSVKEHSNSKALQQRAAQLTTLAPPWSKYRICDKK